MNRLRFRAWDKVTKKMSPEFALLGEFLLMGGINLWQYENGNLAETSIEALGDLEVMQYTGCNDKLGNPIFEGDVVKYTLPGETSEDAAMEYIEEVSFVDGCFCVDGYVPVSVTTDWNVEVIGNKYSNPDLLATKPETKD